jgi:hypothetical protein
MEPAATEFGLAFGIDLDVALVMVRSDGSE